MTLSPRSAGGQRAEHVERGADVRAGVGGRAVAARAHAGRAGRRAAGAAGLAARRAPGPPAAGAGAAPARPARARHGPAVLDLPPVRHAVRTLHSQLNHSYLLRSTRTALFAKYN